MGIRSDVAVALKGDVFNRLSQKSKETLDVWFGQTASVTKEGVLFYTQGVKWYHTIYDDLVALYDELEDNFDYEDFLIIQACHDYPQSEEGDLGDWYDNPWEIHRSWSVTVEWYGDDKEELDSIRAIG